MKNVELKGVGIEVSELSLGTMNLPEKSIRLNLFNTAFEKGINSFDTSVNYLDGESEIFLGEFLKGKDRSKLVISSKAFFPFLNSTMRGLSRENIINSIDLSLKRLNSDYLDLFYCHRYDASTNVAESIFAIKELIKNGKILNWGICAFTPFQVCEMYYTAIQLDCPPPTVAQYPYNLFNRTIEMDLNEVVNNLNINLFTYYPLAQGVLTGKYIESTPEFSRASNGLNKSTMWDLKPENIEKVKLFISLAKDWEVLPSALALKWCLNNQNVKSVLSNVSSTRQLDDNLSYFNFKITDEQIVILNKLFNNTPVNIYTGVKYI